MKQSLTEKNAVYIKSKSPEIWGTLQSRPRHITEPYINNIATKEDIVKRLFQNSSEKTQESQIQIAKKAGYVQGVCESVTAVGNEHNMGAKLLNEMKVTKDMAQKFAKPETYKNLEQGIFAPIQEQTQEHKKNIKRI